MQSESWLLLQCVCVCEHRMQNPFYNANSICKMSGGSCAGVELNISYYCHIMATNNRLIAHSAFRILLGAGGFVHFACASVCVCGCRVRGIVSTLTWNVIWTHTTAFNCICRHSARGMIERDPFLFRHSTGIYLLLRSI
jgi:hypothetical protein